MRGGGRGGRAGRGEGRQVREGPPPPSSKVARPQDPAAGLRAHPGHDRGPQWPEHGDESRTWPAGAEAGDAGPPRAGADAGFSSENRDRVAWLGISFALRRGHPGRSVNGLNGERKETRRADRRGRLCRCPAGGLRARTALWAVGSARVRVLWASGQRHLPAWDVGWETKGDKCQQQRQGFGSRSEKTGIFEIRRIGQRLGCPSDMTMEVLSGQLNLHPGSSARRTTWRLCLGVTCVEKVRTPWGWARLPGGECS